MTSLRAPGVCLLTLLALAWCGLAGALFALKASRASRDCACPATPCGAHSRIITCAIPSHCAHACCLGTPACARLRISTCSCNGDIVFMVKAVHDKVSTFEMNLRKKKVTVPDFIYFNRSVEWRAPSKVGNDGRKVSNITSPSYKRPVFLARHAHWHSAVVHQMSRVFARILLIYSASLPGLTVVDCTPSCCPDGSLHVSEDEYPGGSLLATAYAGEMTTSSSIRYISPHVVPHSILVQRPWCQIGPNRVKRGWCGAAPDERAEKREIPEKTRQSAASSGTIPTWENSGVTQRNRTCTLLAPVDRGRHASTTRRICETITNHTKVAQMDCPICEECSNHHGCGHSASSDAQLVSSCECHTLNLNNDEYRFGIGGNDQQRIRACKYRGQCEDERFFFCHALHVQMAWCHGVACGFVRCPIIVGLVHGLFGSPTPNRPMLVPIPLLSQEHALKPWELLSLPTASPDQSSFKMCGMLPAASSSLRSNRNIYRNFERIFKLHKFRGFIRGQAPAMSGHFSPGKETIGRWWYGRWEEVPADSSVRVPVTCVRCFVSRSVLSLSFTWVGGSKSVLSRMHYSLGVTSRLQGGGREARGEGKRSQLFRSGRQERPRPRPWVCVRAWLVCRSVRGKCTSEVFLSSLRTGGETASQGLDDDVCLPSEYRCNPTLPCGWSCNRPLFLLLRHKIIRSPERGLKEESCRQIGCMPDYFLANVGDAPSDIRSCVPQGVPQLLSFDSL
ncbi:hypothetical protein PR048_008032 [Dryococelus australis]|uniref:Uncharacterized protein n=1 Tax=Dryococelus australis TaxID=614101 RepID=A0ABQ9HVY4_9NEOP|nr:hypothetical protein PR048_008032 [Dryococelus australis]